MDVKAWHGIHLLHKNSMKYSGHRKLLCELSKLSKFNAFNLLGYLTNADASILVYKSRPERTGFNMYAEYTRLQLTFLELVPWLETNSILRDYKRNLKWLYILYILHCHLCMKFHLKVSILDFVETHTVFSSFAADANATVNTTDDGIQQAKELFFCTAHSYAAPDYRFK